MHTARFSSEPYFLGWPKKNKCFGYGGVWSDFPEWFRARDQ